MLYLPREDGQGLVEYALILVLVSIVVIVLLTLLGTEIGEVFQSVTNELDGRSQQFYVKILQMKKGSVTSSDRAFFFAYFARLLTQPY